jgi:putative colanic acid biosynthesis acetyltransferase WcaF
MFGAQIGTGAAIHRTASIWAPWNLAMGDNSCIGHDVDCYCVDRITVGPRAVVSQYAFLCSATHSLDHRDMHLVTAPISIEADAWVAARAFIGPGVTIAEGAVVGACAVLMKDASRYSIVAGNPAHQIGRRQLIDAELK